jgi:signal transduction histidine kinase
LRNLGDSTRSPLFPAQLAARSFLGAPIVSPERSYGWACLADKVGAAEFSEEDERLLAILAAQVGRVYENGSLYGEARRRAADLEREVAERQRAEDALRRSDVRLRVLAWRLMEAQETERRHLAHELHDEVGQNLTVLKINLHNARRLTGTNEAGEVFQDSIALVEHTLQQIRNLSLDLRPPLLDAVGLPAALRWYLDRQAERSGLAIQFTADPPDAQLPAGLGIACFRVVQEALTNVLRHAQARRVDVELWQTSTAVQLLLRDDGVGFDVGAAWERATRGTSLGLLGMQERVSLVGGELDVSSTPGQGTQVRVLLPLPRQLPEGAQP